jgi:hypothetical protein
MTYNQTEAAEENDKSNQTETAQGNDRFNGTETVQKNDRLQLQRQNSLQDWVSKKSVEPYDLKS